MGIDPNSNETKPVSRGSGSNEHTPIADVHAAHAEMTGNPLVVEPTIDMRLEDNPGFSADEAEAIQERRGFFLGARMRRSRDERMAAIRKSRASMVSDVDIGALAPADRIPLPDMAAEVKDRPSCTSAQPTTVADRIIGCGELLFIILAAFFVIAILVKLAGV